MYGVGDYIQVCLSLRERDTYESAVLPSCQIPFFGSSAHQIVCHDFRVVASERDMKELTRQPPTLSSFGKCHGDGGKKFHVE